MQTDSFLKKERSGRRREKKVEKGRLCILQAAFLIMAAILIHHIWELQVVNGQRYAEEFVLKTIRTIREAAPRGTIYDRNGAVLAYDRPVRTVTMRDSVDYSDGRRRQLVLNGMIYRVMKTLERNGDTLYHELKMRVDADGSFAFTVTGRALERFRADVAGKADPEELTQDERRMSAEEMAELLAERFSLYGADGENYSREEKREYGLPEEYTKEELLGLAGIRYMLSLNAYRKYIPVVLARDVSEETMAYILENTDTLTGIEVRQDWERIYPGGEAFSHILGYVGKISEEELEERKGSGQTYTAESMIGRTGLEKELEELLHGTDGESRITVNNVGKIMGEAEIVREAGKGADVWLSIDKELQQRIYEILEQSLSDILAEHLINADTFDKNVITDTTDIRIPIGDVYAALFENHVIRPEELYAADAGELERSIAGRWDEERRQAIRELKEELLEGDTEYRRLSGKMQEWFAFLTEDCGILEETADRKEDAVSAGWEKGELSPGDFLRYAVKNGWIRDDAVQTEKKYATAEEMYLLLVESCAGLLEKDERFGELLIRRMISEGQITGREVCLLLYEQGILTKDGDYESLLRGEIDAFSLMREKIRSRKITPAQLALDPCSASAVVVERRSGRILSCVSYPGYDNNRLANGADGAYYSRLLDDASLPLYNRASQQLTAPGSIFKPVTIVAGLQEGVISSDTSVVCDGIFDKVTPSLRCWNHAGHGLVENAPAALQDSCNDYLCETAWRLGGTEEKGVLKEPENPGLQNGEGRYDDGLALHRIQEYARLFHLDEKSGIELSEAEPHVSDAYAIPSSIGQGTHNYSTVQLARYMNVIASRGDVFSLSLLQGIGNTEGAVQEKKNGPIDRVALPDEVWDTVQNGMLRFAQNNSILKTMRIQVAGKTGTAQESRRRPDHALFAGYAPAEEPEITVVVRIVNGYGSSYATRAAGSIFQYCLG